MYVTHELRTKNSLFPFFPLVPLLLPPLFQFFTLCLSSLVFHPPSSLSPQCFYSVGIVGPTPSQLLSESCIGFYLVQDFGNTQMPEPPSSTSQASHISSSVVLLFWLGCTFNCFISLSLLASVALPSHNSHHTFRTRISYCTRSIVDSPSVY